ncbi:MAG: hypothetical protein AAGF11_36815 [Myxococcota bacterium]
MSQGAIIGMLVGVVMMLILMAKRRKRKDALLSTLEQQGPGPARALLDRTLPAMGTIPLGKIVDQCERMASLAIIGDTEALRAEIDRHEGKLTAIAQVNGLALLGLAIRSDDPAPHAQALTELSARMDAEGGLMMKLVKDKLRTYAGIAQAITGQKVERKIHVNGRTLASKETGTPKIVLLQALARALEGTGGHSESLRAEVRASTRAFDDPPAPPES